MGSIQQFPYGQLRRDLCPRSEDHPRRAGRVFYPQLQALFPDRLGSLDAASFVRSVNAVRPGSIRGDADEVTYGLHIILRFEVEQELLAGSISVRSLPEVWNARMLEYLGVEVPDRLS